jgi:hypothetical protein
MNAFNLNGYCEHAHQHIAKSRFLRLPLQNKIPELSTKIAKKVSVRKCNRGRFRRLSLDISSPLKSEEKCHKYSLSAADRELKSATKVELTINP